MIQYREIIRQLGLGMSQAQIAASCGCARKTVRNIAAVLKERSLAYASLQVSTDTELETILFPGKHVQPTGRKIPDFEFVSKELTRNGVTLKLVWMEYCEECRQAQQQPFMYSQFCYHFHQYAEKERATMHIPRKPGDRIEVDWAGDKLYMVDRDTGASIPAFLFVGVLPFSMYAYAEVCSSMDTENWMNAHVNMFRYFGGSAIMLVPDKLKTGVDHTQDQDNPTN